MGLTTTQKVAVVAVAALMLAALSTGCTRTRAATSGTAPAAAGSSSAPTTSGPAGAPSAPVPAAPLQPIRKGAIAPPAVGAYLGVFHPPGPFDRNAMDAFLKVAPKKPAIVMWYQQWGSHGPNRFDPAMVAAVYKRGAVPMISWEPWDPGSKPHNLRNPADSPAWSLASIASGKRDAYLRSWALGIKAIGGPVFLRPMHEMNGNWYPWSGTANGNNPQEFIAAWRHMHDIFKQVGANNVTWVWSVNYVDKPATPANVPAAYYPGAAYVDWVSVSGFNWGTTIGNVPWKTFDNIFTTPLTYLKTLGKPILIGETAAVEQGGDKPGWITQTYGGLQSEHPEIKAIIYYDAYEKGVKHGIQDWRIQSSAASVQAYRTAVAAPYLVGGPIPELVAWEKSLSAAATKTLAAYRRIY